MNVWLKWPEFQHTAARRRLLSMSCYRLLPTCFNTQPPEGGWVISRRYLTSSTAF
ncbi:hypothetical protein NEISUBOT_04400, partial [Neisseria subflava NJ9703]